MEGMNECPEKRAQRVLCLEGVKNTCTRYNSPLTLFAVETGIG
jgi:hypothetical protein